jgi:anti-sigma-K factor RskA
MTADIHSLSGADAVDALDAAERAEFERHLAECPECQAEVASLREAASQLTALTTTAPAASLRESVLSGIRTVRPLPPLTGVATEPEPSAEAPVAPSSPDGARTVVPLRRRPAAWLAGIAAAVLLAVGGLVWSPWDNGAPRGPQPVAEQVLHAKDAQRFEKTLDGARATIVRSPSLGRAVIVADHMPPAPSGKDYQLWFALPGRGMVNAGLMPHQSGDTVTYVLQGDAKDATGAGITVEPAGGSPAPTTTPIALFSFS